MHMCDVICIFIHPYKRAIVMFDLTTSSLVQVLRRYNVFAIYYIFLVELYLTCNVVHNIAVINSSKRKRERRNDLMI